MRLGINFLNTMRWCSTVRPSDAKTKLAHLFIPKQASEDLTKVIFIYTMESIGEILSVNFNSTLTNHIWERVSPKPIKDLDEKLIKLFYEKVLHEIPESDAIKALKEFSETRFIRDQNFVDNLHKSLATNREAILKEGHEEALNKIPEMIDDIVHILLETNVPLNKE